MENGPREEMLRDFTAYCLANPSERFWQALRKACRS